MSNVPSKYGSLIKPFQPTVVRGFSKYTRITMSNSFSYFLRSGNKRSAYSMAALGSWMEHGPIITNKRLSRPCTKSEISWRVATTNWAALSLIGNSYKWAIGGNNSLIAWMRTSSVFCKRFIVCLCYFVCEAVKNNGKWSFLQGLNASPRNKILLLFIFWYFYFFYYNFYYFYSIKFQATQNKLGCLKTILNIFV